MKSRLGPLQISIVVLTVITALIHLALGIASIPDTLGYLFVLNAVTYLVLIVALYFIPQLAERRSLIRWVLLAFAALTFVLYFVFNWPNIWGIGGLVDKTVELLLIILLFLDRKN